LEGFFCRQVTRWLAEKLDTAKEFLRIKRTQIVRERPQEFHNILEKYPLSTFVSIAYGDMRPLAAAAAFANLTREDT
jgi:hypothetical protein